MQDELRITLVAIGAAFIVGILLHGVWTMRKNKNLSKPNNFQPRHGEPKFEADDFEVSDTNNDNDDDIYDDVGVGQARVISVGQSPKSKSFSASDLLENDDEITLDDNQQPIVSPLFSGNAPDAEEDKAELSDQNHTVNEDNLAGAELAEDFATAKIEVDDVAIDEIDAKPTAPIYSGVVTQPKPEFNRPARSSDLANDSSAVPEPPGFLLKKSDGISIENADEENSQTNNESEHNEEPQAESNPVNEQKAKEAPAPDFALDVQDGPVKTPEQVTSKEADSKLKGVEKELSFAEQAKRFVRRNKKTVAEKIRKEPQVRSNATDEQMRIDFASTDPALFEKSELEKSEREKSELDKSVLGTAQSDRNESGRAEPQINPNKTESAADGGSTQSAQTDVLVLNIKANSENPIGGAALLPMLLTLGFKFGEHDIFHRHVNTNGKGPILFSLTNLFKPGVFDIDNMETFSTQGLSLFMMLPIEGEAQQVFNMMHNAARKIAEEFGCKILDGNRVVLSKQSLQQYSERIRDFERRRLSR